MGHEILESFFPECSSGLLFWSAEPDNHHADQQRRHAEMACGGGRALHKTVGAPDEKRQAKNYSDEGQCHTEQELLESRQRCQLRTAQYAENLLRFTSIT